MTTPSFVPEAPSGFLGISKKDNFSLKLWFVIAWTGFLFLPWYGAYDGFWSFIWVTDGYPTFDEYSPGILQIILHQRWWLWPAGDAGDPENLAAAWPVEPTGRPPALPRAWRGRLPGRQRGAHR